MRNQDYVFTYDGDILEIVDSYKYLGILFNANGNFRKRKVNLKEQVERAMFALLKCGLSCLWNDINDVETKWLVETVKMNLKDQFKQTWLIDLNTNDKCINYRIFKPNFGFEDYLSKLDSRLRMLLCKFRLVGSLRGKQLHFLLQL